MLRPGSQVVRHSSAKGICGGSIPPQASKDQIVLIFMLECFGVHNRPDGGTGIRARLKIVSRKGCGFDPHSGHWVF